MRIHHPVSHSGCSNLHSHRRRTPSLLHILLHNAAVGAGAGDQRSVQTVSGSQLGSSGGHGSACLDRSNSLCHGSSFHNCGSSAGLQAISGLALGANCTDVLHAGNFLALFEEDGQQLTFCGRLALEGSLVGFVSKQNVADLDIIADGLQPLANDAGFDSDAGLGHDNCLGLGVAGNCCGSSGGCGCSCRSCCGLSGCAAALQTGNILTGVADRTNVDQAGYFVALFEEDLQQSALCGRFTLEGSLIGLVGEQNVADLNGIADLLFPSTDDTAFHCNARLGHDYCICHGLSSLYFVIAC